MRDNLGERALPGTGVTNRVHQGAAACRGLQLDRARDMEDMAGRRDGTEKDETELVLTNLVIRIGNLRVLLDKTAAKQRDGEIRVTDTGKDGQFADIHTRAQAPATPGSRRCKLRR